MKCDLLFGNCIDVMETLPLQSIHLILTDLPYGVSGNKWDTQIPLDKMWACFKRILVENGSVVLTATQPFASKLVSSNEIWFKYEVIWEKTVGSGQLNIRHQPLKTHENVLIFYNKLPTYNEQLTTGTPYTINRTAKYKEEGYGQQRSHTSVNEGTRHAKTVLKISNPRIKNGHPTQKPIELMQYFIKTFTNENDTVLDCCMGSGTTGMACKLENRNFVGIENDEHWFSKASIRLEKE